MWEYNGNPEKPLQRQEVGAGHNLCQGTAWDCCFPGPDEQTSTEMNGLLLGGDLKPVATHYANSSLSSFGACIIVHWSDYFKVFLVKTWVLCSTLKGGNSRWKPFARGSLWNTCKNCGFLACLLLCIAADFGGSRWQELNLEECWHGSPCPLVARMLLLAIPAPLPLRQILNTFEAWRVAQCGKYEIKLFW